MIHKTPYQIIGMCYHWVLPKAAHCTMHLHSLHAGSKKSATREEKSQQGA
jgi:hypothetical protein